MSFYSSSQLRDLYHKSLKKHLKDIELERIKLFRTLVSVIVVGIILFLLLHFNINSSLTMLLPLFFVLFFLSIPYVSFLFLKFKREYKHKIVKEVMTLIDPTWKYDFKNRIPDSSIFNSKIFDRKEIDRIIGDDYIYGAWKGVPFQISELRLDKVTYDQKNRAKYHKIFHGLFCEIRFNKKIHGETFIFPDETEKFVGKFLGDFIQGLSSLKGQQVKLENPDFEKNFNCYSHDQVEARYIITPIFMEKLLYIKQKLGCNLFLSFSSIIEI